MPHLLLVDDEESLRSVVAERLTDHGFEVVQAADGESALKALDGFAFDVEVLLLADRLGYKIADLPVEWRNSPDSRVRLVRDSLAMFRDMLCVRRLVDAALPGSPGL